MCASRYNRAYKIVKLANAVHSRSSTSTAPKVNLNEKQYENNGNKAHVKNLTIVAGVKRKINFDGFEENASSRKEQKKHELVEKWFDALETSRVKAQNSVHGIEKLVVSKGDEFGTYTDKSCFLPTHVVLEKLNKIVDKLKSERSLARKTNQSDLARRKSKCIESFNSLINLIEDSNPKSVQVEFEYEGAGHPQLDIENTPEMETNSIPQTEEGAGHPQLNVENTPEMETNSTPQTGEGARHPHLDIENTPEMETNSTPQAEEGAGHPQLDIENTPEMETNSTPQMGKGARHPHLDIENTPEMETNSTSQTEEGAGHPQLDIENTPEMETNSTPQAEEGAGHPQLDIENTPEMETNSTPQMGKGARHPHLDIENTPEMETNSTSQTEEGAGHPQLDIENTPEMETNSTPQAEEGARHPELDIENTPEMETNSTPQMGKGRAKPRICVKGRRRNYCGFCEKLVTNFSRHIETNHPDSEDGRALLNIEASTSDPKIKKMKKQYITDSLRKNFNNNWNLQVMKRKLSNKEEPVELIPVKRRFGVNIENDSVICSHCLGLYKRTKLSVHLQNCHVYKIDRGSTQISPNKFKVQAIKQHGEILMRPFDEASVQLQNEVLRHMRHNSVTTAVQQDPLILKMGTNFHKSRRHPSEKNYVSREMRDMGKLLITLKNMDGSIKQLEDVMKPSKVDLLIKAVEIMGKYDKSTGNMQVMSVPYRILTPLNLCTKLVRKQRILEACKSSNNDRSPVNEIDDFSQTIKDIWPTELGRLSVRARKVNKSLSVQKLAEEEDIVTLCNYIINKYDVVMNKLNESPRDYETYSLLMDMLISHIMCLYRRRPVDLKRANLLHYNLLDHHDELIDMARGGSLSDEELDKCKSFHIFYAPGKGYEIVPIVLTPKMKEVLDCLVVKRSCVEITDDRLFLKPRNCEINPVYALEKIKKNVSLRKPKNLTNNGLRHQAATFSRLHSSNPLYQDYLASALGHTLFIHKQNYELPTSILQKLIVCPILHKMTMKDKRHLEHEASENLPNLITESSDQYHLKEHEASKDLPHLITETSNQVKAENSYSSGFETPMITGRHRYLKNLNLNEHSMCQKILLNEDSEADDSDKDPDFIPSDDSENECWPVLLDSPKNNSITRKRWTKDEREKIFEVFGHNILIKKCPKRNEIVRFKKANNKIFATRTDDQVVAYISNASKRKMKNVSPEVKRFMARRSINTN